MFWRRRRKVAFVAGVKDYASPLSVLPTCVDDAKAMAERLDELRFSVTYLPNPVHGDLQDALAEFIDDARGAEVGLIYFSGHGIQHNGENYLLAVDANPYPEDGVYRGVKFSETFAALSEATNVTIGILDACRDSPEIIVIEGELPAAAGEGAKAKAGAGKQKAVKATADSPPTTKGPAPIGLAEREVHDDESNAFIGYAAAAGKAALLRADSKYSYFTEAFLEQIDVPGLPIDQMFQRAAGTVALETRNAQRPWQSQNLSGTIVLRQRSNIPMLGLFGLAILGYFVCFMMSALNPLNLTLGGMSPIYGILFTLLVGFAVWRWGEAARPALAAGFAMLAWIIAVGLQVAPAPQFSPEFLAVVVSLITMGLLAVEVKQFREAVWIAAPAAVVGAGSWLYDLAELSRWIGPDYFQSSVWIVPFSFGLGFCFASLTYSRSNRQRRLLHHVETPRTAILMALLAGVGGALVAFSGGPFAKFELFGMPLYLTPLGVNVNLAPGLVLAVCLGLTLRSISERDLWLGAILAVLLWIVTVCLVGLLQPIVSALLLLQPARVVTGGLILGLLMVGLVGLLHKGIWHVPVWLFAILASVVGTLPYCLWVLIERGDLGVQLPVEFGSEISMPIRWAVLYGFWAASIIGCIAFAISPEKKESGFIGRAWVRGAKSRGQPA